jgi:hypothetical protein
MAGSKLNIKSIMQKVEKITDGMDQVSEIGWFEGAIYPDGTPVAYVAAIQEFGSPEVSIPPRLPMRATANEKQGDWADTMKDGLKLIARGDLNAYQVLETVGIQAEGDISKAIEAVDSPPQRPITLVLRKWRREGRTITGKTVGEAAAAYEKDPSIINGVLNQPLTDTGYMIATLTHVVKKPEVAA